MWSGNYSAYAVARELALVRRQQQWVTQQKEIARLEEAIRRPRRRPRHRAAERRLRPGPHRRLAHRHARRAHRHRGSNGAGKTVLAKVLTGDLGPTEGERRAGERARRMS
jgi:ATPase subunit of ABC transporter with duplicated ATPase domains